MERFPATTLEVRQYHICNRHIRFFQTGRSENHRRYSRKRTFLPTKPADAGMPHRARRFACVWALCGQSVRAWQTVRSLEDQDRPIGPLKAFLESDGDTAADADSRHKERDLCDFGDL